MADAKDPKLALFELYLATAEKLSDRRAQANAWMGTRPGRFASGATPSPRCLAAKDRCPPTADP